MLRYALPTSDRLLKADTVFQKVPCTFEHTVSDLGYLDGNAGQEVGITCESTSLC